MKRFLMIVICLLSVFSLCACGHVHQWKDATCTEPKTCVGCGLTEGEALGHDWGEPTCTEPKKCKACGLSAGGTELGHDVKVWVVVIEPTCTTSGKSEGRCKRCNKTVERAEPMLNHTPTPSDWEIIQEATEEVEGIKVIKCSVCGAILKSEKYNLSPEEAKALFIKKCKSNAYKDISRDPDGQKGQYVVFKGKVLQVCSEATSSAYYSTYRVGTGGYGYYDDVVFLRIDNYGTPRLLEDDMIRIYGVFDGLYTYETVLHSTISIPQITVKYYDLLD